MGFDMKLSFSSFDKTFSLHLRGNMTYQVELGTDTFGNITRINNAFEKIPQRLLSSEAQLQTLFEQMESAKSELAKPFAFESELAEKTMRLTELDAMLNMDEQPEPVLIADEEFAAKETELISAKEKPSILAALKQGVEKSRRIFSSRSEPEKKPEIYI